MILRIAEALRGMHKKEKGFTLIELLIVVAIIAVLVAIILPIFTNQVNKARTSADKANERLLQAQVDLFLPEVKFFVEGWLGEGEENGEAGAEVRGRVERKWRDGGEKREEGSDGYCARAGDRRAEGRGAKRGGGGLVVEGGGGGGELTVEAGHALGRLMPEAEQKSKWRSYSMQRFSCLGSASAAS